MKRKRQPILDKRATEFILSEIRERGLVIVEDVMDLIEPHQMFDPAASRLSERRAKALSLISRVKNENGKRQLYIYKDAFGESIGVDIDSTEDLNALKGVRAVISPKHAGLNDVANRINKREIEIKQRRIDVMREERRKSEGEKS